MAMRSTPESRKASVAEAVVFAWNNTYSHRVLGLWLSDALSILSMFCTHRDAAESAEFIVMYWTEISVDLWAICMDEVGAQFGWTMYAVVEQKQNCTIVLTTAGEDTTADTTKTCQFTVPVVRITNTFLLQKMTVLY